MNEFFKDIKSDKITNIGFTITAILIAIIFVFTLFLYHSLPPFVPVFNQLPWGEKRLGVTLTIFIPILTALGIFAVNLFTSSIIYKRIPLVSRMLAGTSLLISVLIFLFIARTILLII